MKRFTLASFGRFRVLVVRTRNPYSFTLASFGRFAYLIVLVRAMRLAARSSQCWASRAIFGHCPKYFFLLTAYPRLPPSQTTLRISHDNL